MTAIVSNEKIPNNVNLSSDKRLQRALEQWLPNYLGWWKEMGPEGFQANDVYLRTAISVAADGWANFDYVKMPDYRWGIFLEPAQEGRKVGFGDHADELAWQQVPGEYRSMLQRLIVTQGDTEPASVEQQRLLGQTAPSLYDMRNLFQVNVEEGRHLWAMVYLLHSYFGSGGREEAESLLERRSGNPDKPRILGAFNAPMTDWLQFFMFTTFTDRDGKFQLLSLAESGFDPLARTCRFMLTEEAHHMFVGESGVARIIQRTCELMKQHPSEDVTKLGGIPLDMIQRSLNMWCSLSFDLFGGEISSNAASYFASGLKGRAYEQKKYTDHLALEGNVEIDVPKDGRMVREQIPLRVAMNEILRSDYRDDNERVVRRWNEVLEENEITTFRFKVPSTRFHRSVGVYAGHPFAPDGQPLSAAEWEARKAEFLISDADLAYLRSIMTASVTEAGKFASYIAPPRVGIKGRPVDFEYVRL
jgi:benzoyl-CoA 2,3-dioxygenase component B